jgi:uncharacterized phage-associated protein
MSFPSTAMAVANFFITKGLSDQESPKVDHLKLQKLVYYAYCWWAGNKESQLFEQDIYAWKHGPVVQDIYDQFKHYKASRITGCGQEYSHRDRKFVTPEVRDGEVGDFLEAIWASYGHLDGIQLSNMTHEKDGPWHTVWYSQGGQRDAIIPFDVISEEFKRRVEELDNGSK